MSFPVDQFMQVKCKLALNSDSDTESIQVDNERVRLCSSVHDRNATLIVLICSNHVSNNNILTYYLEKRNRPTKPRIKQIFYHHYNEDIVALGLSETGNKLVLISSSSTIYLLPIKNILLRSSAQCKSMYFYDASILNCCTIDNPVAVVYWESSSGHTQNNNIKSTIIVAGEKGKISFISVDDKKEFNATNVNEKIINMELIKDMCSYSLLITCENFKQYRFTLELIDRQSESQKQQQQQLFAADEYINLSKEVGNPSWDRKPILIKLQSSSIGSSLVGGGGASAGAAATLHRVLVPSGRAGGGHANLFTGRERSIPLMFYHSMAGMISIADVLGAKKSPDNRAIVPALEPRLLRFFSSKQFYYRPQKPTLITKLNSLSPDERITHLVLTDRFLAIATDSNRFLINSRNCCNQRNPKPSIELDPVIKEVTFTNDEKILLLLKSPICNDQDNIIDSFLLVTSKSIYSIEARQSCRDMFINLIDGHLGIKPPRVRKSFTETLIPTKFSNNNNNPNEYILVDDYRAQRKYSESNLMVSNFLSHRDEVYERINYDSRAFSILFKLELNSLYEAYGDKLMLRNQFDLANRFFQMAKFDHTKTLGKYIRLGALRETIDYVTNILCDENEILDEKERIDLARAAFECLLAKTIIERSKTILYYNKMSRTKLRTLLEYLDKRSMMIGKDSPIKREDTNSSKQSNYSTSTNQILDLFKLCEHSPLGHAAKLSGNTIVDESNNDDDEATMTNTVEVKSATSMMMMTTTTTTTKRLECEKALISFIRKLLPSSLYSYVMTQLVDFGLIDLADTIARSDVRIHTLTRILLKSKEENKIIFRDGRFDGLVEKLAEFNHDDLIRIDSSEPKFLEFITSLEVTRALVKDINVTSEYLGYQKTPVQFRKYSYTALRQLESFRKFVLCQQKSIGNKQHGSSLVVDPEDTDQQPPLTNIFTKQQKKSIENIFVEFLKASLNESTDDSCKLWFNYINFYLNYVGTLNELESDTLNLFESGIEDCRFAITLYKAIVRDGLGSTKAFICEGVEQTPLENMGKLYNLAELFGVEFLLKLLKKTLELLPKSCYNVYNFSHMLVLE